MLLHSGLGYPGYLNPGGLEHSETIDLLTTDGEHESIPFREIKCISFVRDFAGPVEPERRSFFSRPKLEGLWVRLRFRNDETLEGVVPNDLLGLLEIGIHLTPPDLNGNSLRLFIPRSSLKEMIVLGVVGSARRGARTAKPAATQPSLFSE